MHRFRFLAVTAMLAAASLTGCGVGTVRTDVVIVNAGEPQNPLIPTNTNDSNGGRIVDRLFAGLMSYDAKGRPALEVASAIETTDDVNYRITLKPGWTFSDGSPVTAHSFVDAWNYGALATNAQLQQSFFSPIAGFDEVAAATPTATAMSGLQVINDHQFTVRLKGPTIDFTLRLGFSPFYPLPAAALKDMSSFGQHPIGNGPYRLADAPGNPAWQHNVKLDLMTNPGYHGNRMPQNKGLRFVFYANLDTAYADLLSSNLDVLETIPPSVLPVYRRDLGDRAVTAPAAANQSLDTPLRLPHFSGEEGRLRRLALSAAVNRDQICRNIFSGARAPARDFTASSLPGFDAGIDGNDALNFDPDRARRLWSQADAISKWTGRYAIAYNADGSHQEWVDAIATSIKNTLGHRRRGGAPADVRRLSDSNHQSHDRHRIPRGVAGRLSVDAGVLGAVVRHRCRRRRCRLLQPPVRRRDGRRRSRSRLAAVVSARQRCAANPVAGHAGRTAVVHGCRRRTLAGGQPRRADLERAARLRRHREGLRWSGTSPGAPRR